MSIGAILTGGLGSFGSVNLLVTLGYLSGTALPPAVVADTHDGGGYYETVKVKTKKRPQIEGNVREWLIEAFKEATEEPATAQAVAEVVKPFVRPNSEPQGIPTPRQVDWSAVLADVEAVQRIMAIAERADQIEREREDDDETLLMLMV